jgi:predicted nucleic-acid-binding Zn-ribbon protein
MSQTGHVTIPDWTCAHCGNKETLELRKAPPGLVVSDAPRAAPHHPPGLTGTDAPTPEREVPTLDWTCSRCGMTETYMLVPVRAQAPAQ